MLITWIAFLYNLLMLSLSTHTMIWKRIKDNYFFWWGTLSLSFSLEKKTFSLARAHTHTQEKKNKKIPPHIWKWKNNLSLTQTKKNSQAPNQGQINGSKYCTTIETILKWRYVKLFFLTFIFMLKPVDF